MNPDFGHGLIALLQELRAARVKGDKQAVEAAGRSLDEHVGSTRRLFDFLDERRRQVKPSLEVEQIIDWVQRESRHPSRWSIASWGMMSQDFEFEHLKEWLATDAVPMEKWSKGMTKTRIVTALRLLNVYDLNKQVEAGVFTIRPVAKNRQKFQVLLDGLTDEQKSRLAKA